MRSCSQKTCSPTLHLKGRKKDAGKGEEHWQWKNIESAHISTLIVHLHITSLIRYLGQISGEVVWRRCNLLNIYIYDNKINYTHTHFYCFPWFLSRNPLKHPDVPALTTPPRAKPRYPGVGVRVVAVSEVHVHPEARSPAAGRGHWLKILRRFGKKKEARNHPDAQTKWHHHSHSLWKKIRTSCFSV